MNRDELQTRVRDTIHEVEPRTEVILYGSRSRGDENSESDWDFLILVHGSVDDQRTDNIRHRLRFQGRPLVLQFTDSYYYATGGKKCWHEYG